jgi:hypothetical protein
MKRCFSTPLRRRNRTIDLFPLTDLAMRRGLNRMRVQTLTLAVAILSLGSIGLSQQSTPAPITAVSRVHQLVVEDQSENPGNISEEEFNRHGDARRAETRKLLAEGKIVSGEDFSDASLIFQHGQIPDDFLFAHILAVEALTRGGSADKWMAAATLDRYLQSINQPQVFGTQYSGVKSAGNTPKAQVDPLVLNIQRTQQPYDPKLLSDSIREGFCVPNVAQQEKNLAIFNTGHRPERKLMRASSCSH